MNTRIPAGRGNPQTKEPPTEEGEGGSGSQTNSTQDLSGNTTKWWRNYPEQTSEQKQEKSLKTLYTWKNELKHNLPTPAQQKTRGGGQTYPQTTSWFGKAHQRKTQQEPKTKDIHRANINHSPRSVSLGDQGDCTTESHRPSTIEVHTINPGSHNT